MAMNKLKNFDLGEERLGCVAIIDFDDAARGWHARTQHLEDGALGADDLVSNFIAVLVQKLIFWTINSLLHFIYFT